MSLYFHKNLSSISFDIKGLLLKIRKVIILEELNITQLKVSLKQVSEFTKKTTVSS